MGPNECSNINTKAVVPSNQDTRSLLACLQSYLENDIEPQLAKAKEKWEMFGEKRDADYFQQLKDQQQKLYQQINTIQMFNRDAGSLYACSGFRVHPQSKFGLDWALVKLPNHRSMQNLVCFSFYFIEAESNIINLYYSCPREKRYKTYALVIFFNTILRMT